MRMGGRRGRAARKSWPEVASVNHVRGKVAGSQRRGLGLVGVLSVVLAIAGGVFSLLFAWLVGVSIAFAAEGNDPQWTASELAYIGVWGLVGLTVLCGAWLPSRRPWAGVCSTAAAAAVLLLNVTLLGLHDSLVDFVLWCIVATPLLLAAALGVWRALALRGGSRASAAGPDASSLEP